MKRISSTAAGVEPRPRREGDRSLDEHRAAEPAPATKGPVASSSAAPSAGAPSGDPAPEASAPDAPKRFATYQAAARGAAADHGGGRLSSSPLFARHRADEQPSTRGASTAAGGPVGFLGRPQRPVDAAEFAAMSGIVIDDAEAARLDALVQKTAARMGLAHPVGFARETDFQGYYSFAFVGTVRVWDRPEQKILVGAGVKATKPEHLAPLGPVMPAFRRVHDDFLALSEEEKIEVILVHEAREREAIDEERGDPHRTAVQDAPKTRMTISPRARRHLDLYATVDRGHFGPVPP